MPPRRPPPATLQDLFSSLLDAISSSESLVETSRQSLAEDISFCYFQFYKLLDPSKEGFLTAGKLLNFAELHSVLLSQTEACSVLQGMDWNNDGRVSITDFSMAVLPWMYPTLRELAAAREAGPQYPSVDTMRLFIRWMNYEILYYRSTEKAKSLLFAKANGLFGSLFRAICPARGDSFTFSDLSEYCRTIGYFPGQRELANAFMRLSRYGSGTVKYAEFCKCVTPMGHTVEQPPETVSKPASDLSLERSFVTVCREMVRLDSRVERLKCDLASRADFTIPDAFRLFDGKNLGFLQMDDIKETCRAMSIFPTGQEVYRLLRRFGSCNGNHISLKEFEAFLTPTTSAFAQDLQRKVPLNASIADRGLVFTPKTVTLLRTVFATAIENESQIARSKGGLTTSEAQRYLFAMLDCGRHGVVSSRDLDLALNRLGDRYSPVEVQLLFQRIEKRARNGFDFSAFCEEFCATQPKW